MRANRGKSGYAVATPAERGNTAAVRRSGAVAASDRSASASSRLMLPATVACRFGTGVAQHWSVTMESDGEDPLAAVEPPERGEPAIEDLGQQTSEVVTTDG